MCHVSVSVPHTWDPACLVYWVHGDMWYLGLLMLRGEVHLDKVSGGGAGTVSICKYQDIRLYVCMTEGPGEDSLGSLGHRWC